MYFCVLYLWTISFSQAENISFPHLRVYPYLVTLFLGNLFSKPLTLITSGCHNWCVLKQALMLLVVDGKWSRRAIMLQQTWLTSSSCSTVGRSAFTVWSGETCRCFWSTAEPQSSENEIIYSRYSIYCRSSSLSPVVDTPCSSVACFLSATHCFTRNVTIQLIVVLFLRQKSFWRLRTGILYLFSLIT